MGLLFRFSVLSAVLLACTVSFASDGDEWHVPEREPQPPRPHVRRVLVYPGMFTTIPASSIQDIDAPHALSSSTQDNALPVPSNSFCLLVEVNHQVVEDDVTTPEVQDAPAHSLTISLPANFVTQALESPPKPMRHKRVEMVRTGEQGASFDTQRRHKKMRDAKSASIDRGETIPVLPITHPSKYLDANDCRKMARRMYEESLDPMNPTILAVQLLERAKAYALSVIIRDPEGASVVDREFVADLLFETCDYKWAATFYERSIEQDPHVSRDTYVRLINCYEELGDLDDARKVAKKLVRQCPGALQQDKKKLKSLTKKVNKDHSLHTYALENGLYDHAPAPQGEGLQMLSNTSHILG